MKIRSCTKLLMLIALCSSLAAQGIGGKAGIGGSAGTGGGAVPKAILTDNFTGTNGTLLSAHTSDSGNTWAKTWATTCSTTASLTGSSGLVSTPNGSCAGYLSNWVPSSADYTVQATCAVSSTAQCEVVARGTISASEAGYLAIFIGGTGVQLFKSVSGVFTQLGSTYAGVTSGTHVIALTVGGTNISVSVDAVSRISVTDSAITVAGGAGVYMLNTATPNTAIMSTLTAQ